MTAPAVRPWYRRRKWQLLILVALVIYGMTGGCYAQQLPQVSAPERELALRGVLPYSVLVTRWDSLHRTSQNPAAYADAALVFLSTAHAFRSVRAGALSSDSADLVAMSTGGYCNSAVVPMFTILTLGVVPTIFTDTDCDGVVLKRYPATPGSDSVVIESRRESRVVMGWAAMLVGILPGWTHRDARRHPATGRVLRAAVFRQESAIAQLMR